ncbi:hypothetical protein, partial [Cellulomonas hominis]|uniref:hypothetical protein n=1 Tax=Cellulomonas hominis TaxID=156981 RepID=UPI001BD04AB8
KRGKEKRYKNQVVAIKKKERNKWRKLVYFQAEDDIRDGVASGGLGNVYKRQSLPCPGVPSSWPRS